MRNYVVGPGEERVRLRFGGAEWICPPVSREAWSQACCPRAVWRLSKWADRRCVIRGWVSSAALLWPLATSPGQHLPSSPLCFSCFLLPWRTRTIAQEQRLMPISNPPRLGRAGKRARGETQPSQTPAWDLKSKNIFILGICILGTWTHIVASLICWCSASPGKMWLGLQHIVQKGWHHSPKRLNQQIKVWEQKIKYLPFSIPTSWGWGDTGRRGFPSSSGQWKTVTLSFN